MRDLDWQHLETFVRVAEHGSLTAAAERLRVSQPTASRHIQALEEELGFPLFVRHARGLTLTDEGADLLGSAREIDQRVRALLRRAEGTGEVPAGSVRISAAEPIGVHAIGPTLGALRREQPKVRIEMVLDNTPANLSQREADIAARMFRPTQLDLVTKRIGQVEIGMFATRGYLRRHGTPEGLDDVEGHTLVGSDRDAGWARAIAEIGASPEDFAYRCDSILAQIQAVRDGLGIGPMHVPIAARDRSLVRVLPDLPIEPLDLWLVMHRDVRENAAVRAVFRHLETGLGNYLASC